LLSITVRVLVGAGVLGVLTVAFIELS